MTFKFRKLCINDCEVACILSLYTPGPWTAKTYSSSEEVECSWNGGILQINQVENTVVA